ncbi:LOW QUALITY PROTEIN: uncharacterized protein LOC117334215 [Pecten maximus]|uniref:LOW QUALITY PROTEIN: uncharacterized protein LOC117334215 n=1 Tax=Pecten maximus TaxID=6579 RepID=UPI0014586201|nr:LOW QUALITY PROTEIN: uncharacterized protein LOC117334215 [Pecten maximus]
MARINGLLSLFRRTVKCYLLLSAVLNAVVSLNPQTCRECILRNTCRPPACSCCNDHMPILSRNNTPQMVFFTFDDAITPYVANFYRELFDSNRTNPNGCPIKMTLFVSHANTVYSLVNEFYKKGMEIGAHSVSHGHMNKLTFKSEAKLQKENIARKAGVPMSEIKGWRSPFLEPIGDQQPKSLNELDYTYDATLTISKKGLKKPPIPFTLDYGWPYDCKIKPCPASAHKGFWEVPVISVMDHLERFDCVYVDGCHTPPPDEETAFKFLWDNFNTYYSGNRAPFGMNMHASWFYYPDRLRAMDRFIKVLSKLPDVYIVSVSQVIDWLKKPTTLSDMHNFKPWGCKNPKITTQHHRRKMSMPSVKTPSRLNRNNFLHNHAEQQRKLRAQQAKLNFMRRQKQREQEQKRLFQQHGIQNSQHSGIQQQSTAQKQNKIPISTGTLGRQQYIWLQRQRARPKFNARKQSPIRKSRITWQQALRHQVMHHVQQSVPSTTPKSVVWEPLAITKPTMPSKEKIQKQKEEMLMKRKRQQLEEQKRLMKERQAAEQKVIAEEQRLEVKKRQDALMHAKKESMIKSKHMLPNNNIGNSKTVSQQKNTIHSKKELRELLRFAENNLVQSRLLFGVGKPQETKPKDLSELKQTFRNVQQQAVVTTTAAPVNEVTTETTTSTTASTSSTATTNQEMSLATEAINAHNFLFDSFHDVVGNNKELWTWAIPKKRQSKKVVKMQSTLPPIKVATTGGFIDFNPTNVYSSVRTAKEKSSKQQSTVAPLFKAKSVQYSIPEEATLIEPNRGLDRTITPLSLGAKLPTMHPVIPREACNQGVTCSLPDCNCLSSITPGNLKSTDIPQIIYITIDGEINFSGFTKMRSLFSRQRKNPNGCPIGATMFVSPTGSSVRLADRIYKDNVEIALQGLEPTSGKSFNTEINDYRTKLSKATSFLPNQITGYRGLDFKSLTDNDMQVLQNKSMYDSSMVTKAKVWPFTLDFGWKGKCENGACPKDTYAGVWEVPVVQLTNGKTKESCNYADGCKSQPNTKQDTVNFLLENFNRHYKSKRSPFGIHLSQKWFHWYYHHNLSGLNKFLDRVLLLKDVYIVSVSNLIDWVKQPTVLSRLNEFQPWQCL